MAYSKIMGNLMFDHIFQITCHQLHQPYGCVTFYAQYLRQNDTYYFWCSVELRVFYIKDRKKYLQIDEFALINVFVLTLLLIVTGSENVNSRM